MKTASFGQINWHDIAKALIVLFLTTALAALVPVLESGSLPTIDQLKSSGIAGLAAAVGYLVKNLLTNSDDQFLKKESA